MSGAFYYTTGGTYHPHRARRLDAGERSICSPKSGAATALDGQPKFDMKFEKQFRIADGSWGSPSESFNLFNNGAVDDRDHQADASSGSRRALSRLVRGGLEESSASRRTNEALPSGRASLSYIVVRSSRVADVPEDRRSLPVLKWLGGLSRQR